MFFSIVSAEKITNFDLDYWIKIISRSYWWAIERYRFLYSDEWKNILNQRKINSSKINKLSKEALEKIKKNKEKLNKIYNILINNYNNDKTMVFFSK